MSRPRSKRPRVVRGWALYDWANSAYFTTTAVALLPTYFASVVVGNRGVVLFARTYAAESLWALAASAGAFLLLLAAPILGAVADFSARKKAFLTVFAVTGALHATALLVVGEGDVALTLVLFLAAQTCFAAANVFYDGFLPDITTPETIDRVSAKASRTAISAEGCNSRSPRHSSHCMSGWGSPPERPFASRWPWRACGGWDSPWWP